jgi:translation elongation factor EF-4
MLHWCFTGKFGGIWVSVVDFRNVTHGNYQERLEREFNMTVITTVPNVSYHAFEEDLQY